MVNNVILEGSADYLE